MLISDTLIAECELTETAAEAVTETAPAKYEQNNYPPCRAVTPATVSTVVVHHCRNHVRVKSTVLTKRGDKRSHAVGAAVLAKSKNTCIRHMFEIDFTLRSAIAP